MNRIILAALLLTVYVAPLNSKEHHAEQRGIAESAERQKSAADLPPLWAIYSFKWPTSEEKKIEPDWRNLNCQNPNNHDEADMCEQRKMSESAVETVYWNKLQVALSAFGFAALLCTIFLTYRATSAAIESNEIARDTAKRELRAYISVTAKHINSFDVRSVATIKVAPVNHGQTPAYKSYIVGSVDVFPFQIPRNFDFPPVSKDDNQQKFDIYPNVSSLSTIISAKRTFSQPEIGDIISGNKSIYVYGTIYYIDIFGDERFTCFCSAVRSTSMAAIATGGHGPYSVDFCPQEQHGEAI